MIWGVLLLPFMIQTGSESGSIVVIHHTRERAIIASDSRITYSNGRYVDNACKITLLGSGVIFAATGILGRPTTDGKVWNVTEVAKAELQEAIAAADVAAPIAEQVARRWGTRVRDLFAAEQYPEQLTFG